MLQSFIFGILNLYLVVDVFKSKFARVLGSLERILADIEILLRYVLAL